LRKEFPKYLIIDCPQDTDGSAAGKQVQKRQGADDVKLPRWEKQDPVAMLDFES
jgi:hypothetical protein